MSFRNRAGGRGSTLADRYMQFGVSISMFQNVEEEATPEPVQFTPLCIYTAGRLRPNPNITPKDDDDADSDMEFVLLFLLPPRLNDNAILIDATCHAYGHLTIV